MELRFEVEEFSGGDLFVGKYINNWSKMYPEQKDGESAQAFKKREEYGRGFRSALAESFEVFVAWARVERYGDRLTSVVGVPSFEIETALFPVLDAAWTEIFVPGQKKNDLKHFWEVFTPVFEEFLFPVDLEKKYEELRRDAILAGEEEPEDSDKEWLSIEVTELEKHTAMLRSRFDIK